MPDIPKTIGRYEIVQRLGRGGMGQVYLARDPRLARTLALKVLAVDGDNFDLQERFSREARSAASMRHPNIVTVYDFGEERGRPFIAMEYVSGESLQEMIRRRAPVTIARKVQLLQELCAGLAYAHKAGMVHRDIKPSNLMVTAEGDLKILDFGLARLHGAGDGLTRVGTMLGTPEYMSPEQIQGQPIDERSDIFSAGLVMYELLTYQRAFSAESPIAAVQKILQTDVPSIRLALPDVDADLERIVIAATRRDPDERSRDADLIARDLHQVRTRLEAQDSATTVALSRSQVEAAGDTPSQAAQAREKGRLPAADAHLAAARQHSERRAYAEAIAACEQALKLDPDDRDAVELLERARGGADESHAAAWIRNARAELAGGRLDEAAALLDRAIAVRPQLTEAVELQAELSRRRVELSLEAERKGAVKRALQTAHAQFAQGAFPAAMRATLEALAHDPNNAAALAFARTVDEALGSAAETAATSHGDWTRPSESTILAPAPPDTSPDAVPPEGTMIIPAGAAAAGAAPRRPSVRLTVVQSPDPRVLNQSFEVSETFEIGREGRDLRASDLGWSRQHAVIEYTNGGYAIRDLSRGGTYVNGRRVRPNSAEPLFFGARITIGSSVLTFFPAADTKLPDLTGTVVAGRYLLEKLLRTSSKGAVYSARQQTVPLRHALKLLSPSLLDYPGYRERFRREAEIAIELHHPHICEVQDYGETTVVQAAKPPINTAYLCLRLMTGGILADRLDSRELIALSDITRWIDTLGDALAYAHHRKVVHGDIKPAAIVFDDDDEPNAYLTDFAIGQPREGDTSPGVIGTPAYMAPEQWDGEPSTPLTDQFGLAALAYSMVTGLRPFEGQDHPEIRRRNFEHGPLLAHAEAKRQNREGVGPAVSRVLARALSLNPGDRYADIKEFSTDFCAALTGANRHRDGDATPRVFLSYQRAGGAGLPLFIVNQLNRHGIEVFIDVQRIDGAMKFPERLTREMQRCDVFVCLLGSSTLESRWVQHEIQLASQQQKPMIPVFHEGYVVPDTAGIPAVDELLSFDGIRLMDQQNLYVEEGVDKLARRIKDTLARDRRAD